MTVNTIFLLLALLAGAAVQHANAQGSRSNKAAATAATPAATAAAVGPPVAVASRQLQQTCSVQAVADAGCARCRRTAVGVECLECKEGYVLRLTGVNCNEQMCCNMIPIVPKTYTIKIRQANGKYIGTDINLLNGVKDEALKKMKVSVVTYPNKWGTGKFLLDSKGKRTSVYRFTPNQTVPLGSSVVIKYNVEDQYGEAVQGSFRLRYVLNSPPVVGRAKARLRVLTAGVTAVYPLKDIRQALAVKDADGDVLTIAKVGLGFSGRGDKVSVRQDSGLGQVVQYYCPSAGGTCANYLGNEIKVNITDGLQFAVGSLIMPVKPRPDLVMATPYVLTGSESLATINSVGNGALEAKGFKPLIRVEFNQSMDPGELVPGIAGTDPPLLPVWIPASITGGGDKADAVEYYPDENYDAVAVAGQLPVPFGDLDAFKKVLTVFNTFVPGKSQAQLEANAAAAGAASRPDSQAAAAAAAAAAARPDSQAAAAVRLQAAQVSQPSQLYGPTVRPAAQSSCSGCMVDQNAACIPNPNDPLGSLCAGACVLDMNGNCFIEGENAPCTTCILDAFGNCLDNGSGNCNNCVPDSFGQWCVQDTGQGGGGGGGAVNDPYELHAWLVPPVKTTAMGFWVSLGCNMSGNITVEFNAANDEDFDGLDSDRRGEFDPDREIDPRRDPVPGSFTGRHRRSNHRLLHSTSSSGSGGGGGGGGSTRRRMLQDLADRRPNNYGQDRCYTLDPGMVTTPAAAAAAAIGIASTGGSSSSSSGGSSGGTVASDTTEDADDADGLITTSSAVHIPLSPTSQYEQVGENELAKGVSNEVKSEDGSSSSGSGSGRRLLARQELEIETKTTSCKYYARKVTVNNPQYDCVANLGKRVGIWFAAWVGNSAGYIRQVRIGVDVVPGGDSSFYVGSMVLSQTQPWAGLDPLLRGKKRRRKV